MSFIADTQSKLDKVARKIQNLNPSAANRLFQLSAAVGHAQNSMYDAWSANDIHQMVGAQAITEQMRAKDIPHLGLRILEWFRNLLIFLPLVVTWFGISSALNSYTTFVSVVNSDPKADKTQLQLPFIYLWQQGFGGRLPDWLVLSKLAFYDFILLLILVALTGIVNIRTHLRTSSKEQEAELLQEELTDALADAALCLTRPRAGQPGGVAGVDISPQLQQLQEEFEKDRLSREQGLTDFKTTFSPMIPILQNLLNGAPYLQQSIDNLRQTLLNLDGPVQQIVNDQQQMLNTVGQLLHEQQTANQEVQQLVNNQRAWGQLIERAINELVRTTQGLNTMPAAINQWTGQLSTLINELSVEHQAQTIVTQQIAEAAAKLQVAFEQAQEAANNLGAMSTHFYDIMNMMKAFPDTVRSSLGQVTRDYNDAAARVAQGGYQLNNAASMLLNVVSRLNGQPHP